MKKYWNADSETWVASWHDATAYPTDRQAQTVCDSAAAEDGHAEVDFNDGKYYVYSDVDGNESKDTNPGRVGPNDPEWAEWKRLHDQQMKLGFSGPDGEKSKKIQAQKDALSKKAADRRANLKMAPKPESKLGRLKKVLEDGDVGGSASAGAAGGTAGAMAGGAPATGSVNNLGALPSGLADPVLHRDTKKHLDGLTEAMGRMAPRAGCGLDEKRKFAEHMGRAKMHLREMHECMDAMGGEPTVEG